MDRKAKIVATLGPSSQSPEIIRKLINAGMDVARLNFSHGTHEQHAAMITMLREISAECKKPIAILQDLQGPKLRVGVLPSEGITLETGQQVVLVSVENTETVKAKLPDAVCIPMDVPDLSHSVDPGNRILLDDGHLEFEVQDVKEEYLVANVVIGGVLSSHKGVNLPGAHLTIPGFTEKDHADLVFGLEHGVDLVAISFVKTAEDVNIVRKAIMEIDPSRADTPIIAKLETPESIENLDEILDVTDGVMVARGDLGVETSPSAVPIVQKKIITAANEHARTVITATQMLDSMIHNPRPTRAEASDVANAVFDGTDAVMLSGETASGSYPIESVMMMDAIVREAEKHFYEWGHREDEPDIPSDDDAVAITRAARELAQDRNVAAIAVFTQTGRTALLMSKARPQVPIYAFCPVPQAFYRMSLFWGVIPLPVTFANNVEEMLKFVDQAMINFTRIQPGQQVVLISGFPVGAKRLPNFALLRTVGEKD